MCVRGIFPLLFTLLLRHQITLVCAKTSLDITTVQDAVEGKKINHFFQSCPSIN